MKFRRQLAALVAVAMMIGCMPGFVFAETEVATEETQTTTEQTEQTEEVQEELPSESAADEDEPEEDPEEEIIETIEVTEEYSVEPAYATDSDVITVSSWSELVSKCESVTDGKVIQLTSDILAPRYSVCITINREVSFTIDLNNHYIDMSSAQGEDCYFFNIASPSAELTVMNGTLRGGHAVYYAGAIMNVGTLHLDNMIISGNSGNYGAVYSTGHLYMNDITVTGNTSSKRGAGVYNSNYLQVQGRIIIQNNNRTVSSSTSYSDNLFLDYSSVVRISENGVSSDSVIFIDSAHLPGAVTYGWNGASNYSVFHFDNGMETQLHEIHGGLEVFGALNYINRSWNADDGVIEIPTTIYDTSVNCMIVDDAVLTSGTYYICRDADFSNRIYIKEGATVNFILADGVTVNCNSGIDVPFNSTLNIYGQVNDSGTLVASASENCAGIGGSQYWNGGNINIYGGTIAATGNNGAGIGGGNGTSFVSVRILGGYVTATGGADSQTHQGGADIGVGPNCTAAVGSYLIVGGRVSLSPLSDSGHLSYTDDLDITNMCVSIDGFYYTADARTGVFFARTPQILDSTITICPCPHTSGTYSQIEGDDDHHNFVCDYCGHQELQLHTFENGTCACGATTGTEAPQFVGHAMQLSGDISLQFFYTLPEGATDSYVTFEGNHIDSSVHYSSVTSNKPGNDQTYYMAQLSVSSIQIADRYTPTLHYMQDGTEHEFLGAPYCIMDYINWGVAQEDTVVSADEKVMLNRLADYGYYSQIYMSAQNGWTYGVDYASVNLGRQPTGLGRDGIEDYSSNYAIVSNIDSAVFSAVTFSMRFADRLSLRVIFQPADGVTVDTSKFNVGGKYDYTISRLSDGRYAVTITGISARDIDYVTNITYDGSSNSVSVSPLSYVYAMMCQDGHDAGKYLVCALVNYAFACGFIPTNTGN